MPPPFFQLSFLSLRIKADGIYIRIYILHSFPCTEKMKEDEDYQLERTAVAERRHMPNSCDFKGGRTYSVDPVPIMRRKDHRKRQVSVHPWSKLVHQQHGYCGNQAKHRTGQKG
jgi:hypothetical protein